jgi:ubiquinone/menaquinone biosynthesis C-methylase UbiE
MSDLKELYNESWSTHFNKGGEDFGDVELSLSFLEQTKKLNKYHNILEIGGGIGKLSHMLQSNGYQNIICTDYSDTAVAYGKLKFPELNLKVMDACSLNFETNFFDRCISFDLVEHLPNIDSHFKEVFRVLNKNGIYLFQTPNIITNFIHETIKFKNLKWRIYHPSLQSVGSLKQKLESAGFKKIYFYKIAPLNEYKLKQLPPYLRIVFNNIPWKILPHFMQIGIWCICEK